MNGSYMNCKSKLKWVKSIRPVLQYNKKLLYNKKSLFHRLFFQTSVVNKNRTQTPLSQKYFMRVSGKMVFAGTNHINGYIDFGVIKKIGTDEFILCGKLWIYDEWKSSDHQLSVIF